MKTLPKAYLWFLTEAPPESAIGVLRSIYTNIEHICIDKDPVAEGLLLLLLYKNKISPDSLDFKIYGYKAESHEGPLFLYLNEEQHAVLQGYIGNKEVCGVNDAKRSV